MIKSAKRFGALLCTVVLIATSSFTVANAASSFTYTVDSNGNATITGCASGYTVSSIPSTIDGYTVVAIGDYAFSDAVGNNITMGTTITLPSTLESIGEGAFEYDTTTTSITIPKNVTHIGEWAFFSCRALKTVTFNCTDLKEIPDNAFKDCEVLTSVTIPDSVETIGQGAFAYDLALTSISLPYNVSSVEKNAFLNCYSLTTATAYNSKCSFGTRVFDLTKSNFTLFGYEESTSETYADNNGYSFSPLADFTGRSSLEEFVNTYSKVKDNPLKYCDGSTLESDYSETYVNASDILNNSSAFSTVEIDSVVYDAADFSASEHSYSLVDKAPENNDGGCVYYICSKCSQKSAAVRTSNGYVQDDSADIIAIPAPQLNYYANNGYDYTRRAASLKVDSSTDTQLIRFPSSMSAPEDSQVTDFGFIYTQTRFLNGGVEPEDNEIYGNDNFTYGAANVYKFSVKDTNGNYTVHDDEVYTFNLVLNINKNNWAHRYAVKAYITYTYDGKSYTVYDDVYSSRSVLWLAQQIVASSTEKQETKDYFNKKILGNA